MSLNKRKEKFEAALQKLLDKYGITATLTLYRMKSEPRINATSYSIGESDQKLILALYDKIDKVITESKQELSDIIKKENDNGKAGKSGQLDDAGRDGGIQGRTTPAFGETQASSHNDDLPQGTEYNPREASLQQQPN